MWAYVAQTLLVRGSRCLPLCLWPLCPAGVQRGLVGEIISRFEKKGFKLVALKLFQCSK